MNRPMPVLTDSLPADVKADLDHLNILAKKMAGIADRLNRAGYAPVYGLWNWNVPSATVSGMLQGNTDRVVLYRSSDRPS